MINFQVLARPYRGIPQIGWWIAGGEFISRSSSGAMGFLALFLAMRFGFSASALGLILSAAGLGTLIGSFLGGYLCDRYAAQSILLACHLGLTILYCLVPVLSSYSFWIITAFLIGTMDYANRATLGAVLLKIGEGEVRLRCNALRRFGINLGAGTGTALSGIVLAIQPEAVYFFSASMTLFAAFLFYKIVPRNIQDKQLSHSYGNFSIAYFSALRDRKFFILLLTNAIGAFIFMQEFSTYKLYLAQAYTLSSSTIGVLLSGNGFIIVLFELPLIHALRKVKPVLLCAMGLLLYGIGFGMLPFAKDLPWAWASLILWTLGEILSAPTSMALAQDRAGKSTNPGIYMGLFTASLALAGLLGPGLGGWLYDWDGGPLLWHICLIGSVLGASLLLPLKFPRKIFKS